MLIRSQDKKILVNFSSSSSIEIAERYKEKAIIMHDTGYSYLLGEYSNEKALKVLDMIQEAYADFEASKITSTGLATAAYTGSYDTPESVAGGIKALKGYAKVIKSAVVFQMPADSKVVV